jgi:hypothetical protein
MHGTSTAPTRGCGYPPAVSTWFSEQLRCASCGHRFSAMMARGIHASRVPQVRAQILRGELHVIACPACDTTSDVQADVSYADFDRKQWVRVAKPANLPAWSEIERDTLAQFDRLMTDGPVMVAELARAFRVRLVFDLDELRERLAIWEAGFDDAMIECAKLISLRERPEIAAHGHRIRMRGLSPEGIVLASVPAADVKAERARWTVPHAIVTSLRRTEWEARMPELFGRGFISIDRYLSVA